MIPHSRPTIDAAAAQAAARVIRSGSLAQGKEVAAFEREVAQFLGRRHGVAVSSGTAALHLALLALGVRPGDEVLIPSYVCAALLQAVRYIGAKPVLLDVDPDELSFCPDEIRKKKSRHTRALILPHPFGFPLDLKPYQKIGVPIVEDCAQAVGAKLGGKRIGRAGLITVLSFYATKMLTTGEGGMLLSDDTALAQFARVRRVYDEKKEDLLAFNYKMTDFQAAIGRVQLRRLHEFLRRRKKIAAFYRKTLLKSNAEILLPKILPGVEPAYHRFVFRHTRAAGLIDALNRRGIGARRPVFKPLHHYLGLRGFPGTDTLQRELVSLPIYPSLTAQEIHRIAATLQSLLRKLRKRS